MDTSHHSGIANIDAPSYQLNRVAPRTLTNALYRRTILILIHVRMLRNVI